MSSTFTLQPYPLYACLTEAVPQHMPNGELLEIEFARHIKLVHGWQSFNGRTPEPMIWWNQDEIQLIPVNALTLDLELTYPEEYRDLALNDFEFVGLFEGTHPGARTEWSDDFDKVEAMYEKYYRLRPVAASA